MLYGFNENKAFLQVEAAHDPHPSLNKQSLAQKKHSPTWMCSDFSPWVQTSHLVEQTPLGSNRFIRIPLAEQSKSQLLRGPEV